MSQPQGHFSAGQETQPEHGPAKERVGAFGDGTTGR
jgi:hypothetical protein